MTHCRYFALFVVVSFFVFRSGCSGAVYMRFSDRSSFLLGIGVIGDHPIFVYVSSCMAGVGIVFLAPPLQSICVEMTGLS